MDTTILPSFGEWAATQSYQLPVGDFIINLVFAFILSSVLAYFYVNYGTSLSNRKNFASNFILLTITTMFIITVVKSSLALSLGLVGALSIVRFRTAIKEPEELAFLFICIAIGLGIGADQRVITLVAVLGLLPLIYLRYKKKHTEHAGDNLFITISSDKPEKITLHEITEILNEHCNIINLTRFDESNETSEATFYVDLKDADSLEKLRNDIMVRSEAATISFLDMGVSI